MLADGIIIVVVVASLVGVLLLRRRSHDDVHTIEGYHRVAHTLEVINAHPHGVEKTADAKAGDAKSGDAKSGEAKASEVVAAKHSYPESAVRLTDSATVHLTHPLPADPPAIAPPEVATRVGAITFDDALAPAPGETGIRPEDPAIGSMNHRPRRLLAPGLAVAAVLVLVAVLIVYGAHTDKLPRHHAAVATTTSTRVRPTTTTTTAPRPVVSAPLVTSGADATYAVGKSDYTLVLSATSTECWISVSGSAGAGIFSGVLEPGQAQTIPATGLVSVEIGAPASFAATVDGTAVTLPSQYQTPLTLHFTPPASAPA